MKKHLIYIVLAILTLPLLLYVAENIQSLFSRAAPKRADIVIDIGNTSGVLNKTWNSYAQGGEESPPMLKSVTTQLKDLSPQYIRLDHIFDYYNIVKRNENGYSYDFTLLDSTIDDIISTGALPYFSLSYMPPLFTSTGVVTDKPDDWNLWYELVKKTIEHYSGKRNRNLTGIYYEVWNEPELPQFGGWKFSGEKDYRLLYYNAAKGANDAENTNPFFLGGPAVGSYYPEWIEKLAEYVVQNNLRLDFYSWHRYHKNPNIFVQDLENTRKKFTLYPQFSNLPLVISEWGIDSENTDINNTNMAAAFTSVVAIKSNLLSSLNFAFEIKDGPPPNGGRWGLFTHEKDKLPLAPKPRFKAFKTLNLLSGERLLISGEGTYVSAIASKSDEKISTMLVNYDRENKWSENTSVTFTGITPASWTINYFYTLENANGKYEIVATDGKISKSFLMPPNSLLYLELTKNAEIANFIEGRFGISEDKALVLSSDAPLIFRSPQFSLRTKGNIGFDIKPLWENNNDKSFLIFEAPYSTSTAILNKLFLAKQKKSEGNFLTLGIASNKEDFSVSLPIDDWNKDTWHSVKTGWDNTGLSLALDDKPPLNFEIPLDIRNGDLLSIYPIIAAIDNLKITLGENQEITRNFDGAID